MSKLNSRNLLCSSASLVAALLLTACVNKPLSVPYDPANFGPPDPVESFKTAQTIGPGDKVRVRVFGVESLSGEFPVEQNGQISYPLIGAVRAVGLTPSQLAEQISQRLQKQYLKNPNVQVAVLQSEAAVTVEGAVNQPGVLPIHGTTTLLQAVALARGTKDDADPTKVVVFRKLNGVRMAAAYNLKAIRRAEAPDPIIYANDVVVVSDSRNRKVFEDVIRAIPVFGMFRPF